MKDKEFKKGDLVARDRGYYLIIEDSPLYYKHKRALKICKSNRCRFVHIRTDFGYIHI